MQRLLDLSEPALEMAVMPLLLLSPLHLTAAKVMTTLQRQNALHRHMLTT
jgi:hypothetical protein